MLWLATLSATQVCADDGGVSRNSVLEDAAKPAVAIQFANKLEPAAEDAADARPIVLTFSAPWCGWCRKLTGTTFADPAVAEVGKQFRWVKVDPDDEPVLAAKYKVHGLPHTLVLDPQQRVLASRPGYIPPEQFVKFLDDALANEEPMAALQDDYLDRLTNSASEDWEQTVAQAIERMGQSSQEERRAIVAALQEAGAASYPVLVDVLEDERLAVRAAAGQTLTRLSEAGLPFDPFADADVRRAQVTAWRAWLAE
jgi:thioredoxin-like negative regulator of GroEL